MSALEKYIRTGFLWSLIVLLLTSTEVSATTTVYDIEMLAPSGSSVQGAERIVVGILTLTRERHRVKAELRVDTTSGEMVASQGYKIVYPNYQARYRTERFSMELNLQPVPGRRPLVPQKKGNNYPPSVIDSLFTALKSTVAIDASNRSVVISGVDEVVPGRQGA